MTKAKTRKKQTFRGRLLRTLLLSALVATVISVILSYVISRNNVQEELTNQEESTALAMLNLALNVDLQEETILSLVTTDTLTITPISQVSQDILDALGSERQFVL